MMENEPIIQPFEEQVQAKAVSLRRKARLESLRASFKRPFLRVSRASASARLLRTRLRGREALHEARTSVRRTSFEIGAVAHSSATLAGVSKDAGRVGAALRGALPKNRGVIQAVSSELGQMRREVVDSFRSVAADMRRAGSRTKAAALRSSTLSGLAIDSQRVAKRVRKSRLGRRGRFAH